ncbi:hypothetical protein [Roseibium sp.]
MKKRRPFKSDAFDASKIEPLNTAKGINTELLVDRFAYAAHAF